MSSEKTTKMYKKFPFLPSLLSIILHTAVILFFLNTHTHTVTQQVTREKQQKNVTRQL
jgi:hypothetical protein